MNDEASTGQPYIDVEKEEANLQDKDESSSKEHDTARSDTGDEDKDSDARSVDSIIYQIGVDSIPDSSDHIQERIKKAPKLVAQHMTYTRLLEDRIGDLETRLQKIESKGIEPEVAAPPLEKKILPSNLILGLNRMSFQEYVPDPKLRLRETTGSPHRRRDEFPGQLPYHLIDIVHSATHQPEWLGKDQGTKSAAGGPSLAASSLAIPAQDPTISDMQLVQPERIRINSSLLLSALQKITGFTFTTSRSGDEQELQDQIILRPFKLLVTFEKTIRDEIQRLENMHRQSDNGNECGAKTPQTIQVEEMKSPSQPIIDILHNMPESSSEDDTAGFNEEKLQHSITGVSVDEDDNPLESVRCLEELRVLRELLDKDLKPTFDLRKQIKDGVARSIAFQDLWHLFPLGHEIVSNDFSGQNQVYRILNVCGGRPFLCSRYAAEMEPYESASNARDKPKFEVLSYFYDSDGKELGARQKLHTIKSYEGNKAITSLPCFPVIYSKNSRALKPRDFFIQRGRRYIELTRITDVMHKRYDGLTMSNDELREEVIPTWIAFKSLADCWTIR